MSPTQTGPLADVHAYLKGKDKDFTVDLPTFEKDIQDDGVRQQVYEYLKGQDKGFTIGFDEFSTGLGVKKKLGGDDSSTGTTAPTAEGAGVDPVQMQNQLGINPADIAPAAQAAQPMPQQLETISPFALDTVSARRGMLKTPGDEYIEAGLPLPSGEELRAQEESRANEVRKALDKLPGNARAELLVDDNGRPLDPLHPDLPEVADGYTRVRLPNGYSGDLPEGTKSYRLPGSTEPAARYFDRKLSDEVQGEGKQSLGLAWARQVNNLTEKGFKGLVTMAGAIENTILGGVPGPGSQFQDTGAEQLGGLMDKTQKPVAPIYGEENRSFLAHPNAKNLIMSSADITGMAIPLVAQALSGAGEGNAAAQMLGRGAGLMFDGQQFQEAHDKAVEADMTPDQTAVYTVFSGGLTAAIFHAGGAALTKATTKLAPAAVQSEIERETFRLLGEREGGKLTAKEMQAVLQKAVHNATPKLLQLAQEGGKMGVLFGANEAKTLLTEAAARNLVGAKFTAPTLSEAVSKIAASAGEGSTIGLLTKGAEFAIEGGSRPGTSTIPEEAAAELPVEPEPEAVAAEPEPELPPAPRPDGAPTPFPADREGAMERLTRMQQRRAALDGIEPTQPEAVQPENVPAEIPQPELALPPIAQANTKSAAVGTFIEPLRSLGDNALADAAESLLADPADPDKRVLVGQLIQQRQGVTVPEVQQAIVALEQVLDAGRHAEQVAANEPTQPTLSPASLISPEPSPVEPVGDVSTASTDKSVAQKYWDANGATGLVFEATTHPELGITLAAVEQVAADIETGKITTPKQLAKALPGAGYGDLESAKYALKSGELAAGLRKAIAIKRAQLAEPAKGRTAEQIDGDKKRETKEIARLEAEVAHPDFGTKEVEENSATNQVLGLPGKIRRVPLTPDALAKKKAYYEQQIADSKGRLADLDKEAGEAVPAPEATSGPTEQVAPTATVKEPLPAAEPHPDHVKPLTAKQQATNDTLDALDRYNALKPGQKKGKEGSAARAEVSRAAKKANIEVTTDGSGKITLAGGQRLTRANEYTATTPAANHVPLESRPVEARPFMDAILAGAETNPIEIQGLGIKIRGKELSGRELSDAVKDIKAGKNTLRAQLILDALENAHRKGYVEKSTGTGLATQKFTVPVGDYLGKEKAPVGTEREVTDDEWKTLLDQDPNLAAAVADYTDPTTGEIDYARLAMDSGRGALDTFYDVTPEVQTKVQALANERAQPTQQAQPESPGIQRGPTLIDEAQALAGSTGEGGAESSGPASGSEGPSPAAQEIATTPASEPEVAPLSPLEQQAAANKASRDRLKSLGGELWDALGKQTGKAGTFGGGVHPEVARVLKEIARELVRLGAGTSKQVIAQIRASDSRITQDVLTDDQIKGIAIEALKEEGKFKAKVKGQALPANEPDGSATRSSMARLDADPTAPEALKERVRDTGLDKYEPKSLADTTQAIDDYMSRNSLADAYAEAISTTDSLTGDVRTALRVRVLKAVGEQLTRAIDNGDTASADAYLDQSYKVAEALAKRGTDAGREINAYKLLVTLSPEAAVYSAQKEVAAQRVEAEKKLGQKATKEGRAVRKAKAEALDNTLATPAVRAAREKVTGKQPETTKERRAAIKAERADLFSQLSKLTSNLGITPQQQAIAELHVKIFKSYIQEGVLAVKSLVERFKRDAGPGGLRGVTEQELRQRAAAAKGDHDEAIRQGTAALGTTLDKIARDHLTDPAAVGKTLAEKFVEGAGLSPADAATYAKAIEAEFARRIKDAQQRRLDELNKRAAATPAKRASQTNLEKTQELFALSPTDDAAILDHLKRVNELPELTAQDVAELRGLAQKIQTAPEGFQKDAAVGELLKRQAQIKGISLLEKLGATWYANILFALKTHGVNIFANAGQLVGEFLISTTHSLIPGSRAFKGRHALLPLAGLGKGLARGSREAYSVLTTGREVSNEPGKYDIPGVLEHYTFAGGKLNPYNYGKYVGRALRGMDALFSTGLREMRAYELATAEALKDKANGVPTPSMWEAVSEKLYNTKQRIADAQAQAKAEGLTGNDYARRVFEIAEQSRPVELLNDSREYGTRAVFNGDPKGAAATIAHAAAFLADNISIGGVKPVKAIIPFTRVVSSVANAYMDYTPIGALRAANSLIRAKSNGTEFGGAHITASEDSQRQRAIGGEERERLLVRAVLGTAAATVLYQLSHDKDEDGNPTLEITGNGTGDVEKDAQLKAATGWMPNSIRYKGRYYGFSNTPLALQAGLIGNINDNETYHKKFIKDDDEALNRFAGATFQSLVGLGDITAVRGPRDFMQATRSQEAMTAYLRRMAASTVLSAIPASNLVQETAGRFYDNKKEAHSFGEAMQRNVPGARNNLNDAIDVLGDPLPVATPRLWNKLEPRDEQTERLWAAIEKQGLFISVPSRQMGGTLVVRPEKGNESPMNDDEFYKFMALRGKYIKAALLTHMGTLEGKDKVAAQVVIENAQENATRQAKRETFGNTLTTMDKVKKRMQKSEANDD